MLENKRSVPEEYENRSDENDVFTPSAEQLVSECFHCTRAMDSFCEKTNKNNCTDL